MPSGGNKGVEYINLNQTTGVWCTFSLSSSVPLPPEILPEFTENQPSV